MLLAKAPVMTGNLPEYSTELASAHPASWRMALASGRTANSQDNTIARKIQFGVKDTIEYADQINTAGNFSS
eukprot:CAMPEP_0172153438 /NCGR_PEP_ID=MMETSP1050-20130122/1445_1 /TAXON_ID=233186 /ORGANISM="Cryptomonas curvata, Strain CCAP979/52" /LENGTH=71 /DNA_ID=CAMNT_0012821975 /DNA_START=197 /DNA_END=412 /DNA_ORIENTATION=+